MTAWSSSFRLSFSKSMIIWCCLISCNPTKASLIICDNLDRAENLKSIIATQKSSNPSFYELFVLFLSPNDFITAKSSLPPTTNYSINNWRMILEEVPKYRPICSNSSKQLAYVIYNSDPMGKPKGVMIELAHIVNRTIWSSSFNLSIKDLSILFSHSFDASMISLWFSLSRMWGCNPKWIFKF